MGRQASLQRRCKRGATGRVEDHTGAGPTCLPVGAAGHVPGVGVGEHVPTKHRASGLPNAMPPPSHSPTLPSTHKASTRGSLASVVAPSGAHPDPVDLHPCIATDCQSARLTPHTNNARRPLLVGTTPPCLLPTRRGARSSTADGVGSSCNWENRGAPLPGVYPIRCMPPH